MENLLNYGDDDIFGFRFQNEFDSDLRFDSGAATPKAFGACKFKSGGGHGGRAISVF